MGNLLIYHYKHNIIYKHQHILNISDKLHIIFGEKPLHKEEEKTLLTGWPKSFLQKLSTKIRQSIINCAVAKYAV